MPDVLIEDDSQQQTTLSPSRQLAKYLQDNWVIVDPAVNDITWQSYWMPTAAVTIAFRESTYPFPMTVGWHKWQYRSNVEIIISAFYDAGGEYPAIVQRVRNRIEELEHIDITAMKTYGISVMRITKFSDIVDYPKNQSYKDDVCDLLIEVQLLGSKTVQTI